MDRINNRLHAYGIIDDYTYKQRRNHDLLNRIDLNKSLGFPKVHVGAVNWLSIDAQSQRYMLSAGADSSIHMWDLDDAKEPQVDGPDVAVSHSKKHHLEFPEIGTIARDKKKGHTFGVSAIQWWPFDNGMFMSSSFDGTLKVWDTDSLSEAYNFNMDTRVYSFDICSVPGSSALVATACDHPFIRLIDLRSTSSAHTLTGHSGKVICTKWSPINEHILASGGTDGSLRLWDIRQSRACVCQLDFNRMDLEFRPPGSISGGKGSHSVRSIESLRSKYQLPKAHRGAVNDLLWSPRGDFIISTGNDDKIRVWSLYPPDGRCMAINFGPLVRNKFPQTLGPCMVPMKQSEQPTIMFPSDSGEILLLNASNGTLVKRLSRGRNVQRSTCIVGQGSETFRYFSGALDGTISVWSPDTSVGKRGDTLEADKNDEEGSSSDEVFA